MGKTEFVGNWLKLTKKLAKIVEMLAKIKMTADEINMYFSCS